jgi:EAL domain-containing protein (putative c-di-GMP-specific phosphodiesterase class I)
VSSALDLLRAPGAIRIELQPIVRVRPHGVELYAVEALARGPRGSSVERPDVLFEYARRKGAESEIDLICIAEALAAYRQLECEPLLSLNIHGATLAGVERVTDRLLDAAASAGVAPDRLMLEVLEHRAPWAVETFVSTLDELRAHGVRIAVDDIGSGASNFRMIVDCRPDHLKIDRHIVLGCGRDPWRRAILQSIAGFARACGAVLIAEGVESAADVETLLGAGIDIMQGWLYGRSAPAHELARSPLLDLPEVRERR